MKPPNTPTHRPSTTHHHPRHRFHCSSVQFSSVHPHSHTRTAQPNSWSPSPKHTSLTLKPHLYNLSHHPPLACTTYNPNPPPPPRSAGFSSVQFSSVHPHSHTRTAQPNSWSPNPKHTSLTLKPHLYNLSHHPPRATPLSSPPVSTRTQNK